LKRRAASIALVLLLGGAASAAQRYTAKLPKWYSDRMPRMTTPRPRSTAMEYVDVGVLVAAMAAASVFALKVRSRAGIFLVMVFSLLYFGFFRGGCVCAIGAIQNVTTAVFDAGYAIPLFVAAFFVLPLAFTLLFGRTFCAAVCPLGAVQDLVGFHPLSVPRWLAHVLGCFAWVYLGLAVLLAATGSAYVICEYDPFVALFRLSGSANMLILGACVLVIGVFVARPYCRFLCPLGALFRLTSPASRWHVTITPDECVQCRLCEDACPYGAIEKANADSPPPPRAKGRTLLAVTLALTPVLVASGAYFGTYLAAPLARVHWQVRLAERIRQEEAGQVEGMTVASEAFRESKQSIGELHAAAAAVRERFETGSAIFGGFLGLVAGLKLVSLSVRRTRPDYVPDRANCLSCGRCFQYCPVHRQRREGAEVVLAKKQ
jgi:ferredoxin